MLGVGRARETAIVAFVHTYNISPSRGFLAQGRVCGMHGSRSRDTLCPGFRPKMSRVLSFWSNLFRSAPAGGRESTAGGEGARKQNAPALVIYMMMFSDSSYTFLNSSQPANANPAPRPLYKPYLASTAVNSSCTFRWVPPWINDTLCW